MTDYHVGCEALGIYAGTLNSSETMWRSKSDVTKEALCAVAEFMLQGDKKLIFESNGKVFELIVQEASEDGGTD